MTYQLTNPVPNPFSPIGDVARDMRNKFLPSGESIDRLKKLGGQLSEYAVPKKNHVPVVDGSWGYEHRLVSDQLGEAAKKILGKINSGYMDSVQKFGNRMAEKAKSVTGYKELFDPARAYDNIKQKTADRIAKGFGSRGVYLDDSSLLSGLDTVRKWARQTGDNIAKFRDVPMQDALGDVADAVYAAYDTATAYA